MNPRYNHIPDQTPTIIRDPTQTLTPIHTNTHLRSRDFTPAPAAAREDARRLVGADGQEASAVGGPAHVDDGPAVPAAHWPRDPASRVAVLAATGLTIVCKIASPRQKPKRIFSEVIN